MRYVPFPPPQRGVRHTVNCIAWSLVGVVIAIGGLVMITDWLL